MSFNALQEHAEKLFRECAPRGFDLERTRLEVLAKNGTLLVNRQEGGADPLRLLRENASCTDGGAVLVDPEYGCFVRRYVLPFKEWTRPGGMKKLLPEDSNKEAFVDYGALRLLKGVPPDIRQYRYGRSRRLSLLLDRPFAVIAVKVFPSNLVDADLSFIPKLLTDAAWVLLARSAVSSRAHHFHMLRADNFFAVERAARVSETIAQESLSALENDLIKSGQDDREIICAMLTCGMSLGPPPGTAGSK